MSIEKELFKRSEVIFAKLEKYGFIKKNNYYLYEKNFLNDDFKAIITIDFEGVVNGKVIDLQTNEEYTNINTDMSGNFVNEVRNEYKQILNSIKANCFENNYFISKQANRITKYIKEKYNNTPEFLWEKFKDYGVFRNSNNDKWYAIIMNINLSKLNIGNHEAEIINVKLSEDKVNELLNEKGYYQAYHMNKKNWISIVLDDTLEDNKIIKLIDASYDLIK